MSREIADYDGEIRFSSGPTILILGAGIIAECLKRGMMVGLSDRRSFYHPVQATKLLIRGVSSGIVVGGSRLLKINLQ